ncbi:MAG: hypothetical protein Q4G02_03140 [bacterium]|nr:hypothetical protein [bacterium]
MLVEVEIIVAPEPPVLTAPETEDWVGCRLSVEVGKEDGDFYVTSARRVVAALFRLGRKEAALSCAAYFARKEVAEVLALAEKEGPEMAFFFCGYYIYDRKVFLKKEYCKFLYEREDG